MKFASTRVVNGKAEFELPDIEEGSEVSGLFFNRTLVRVTDEERQMLLESLDSGLVDDGRDALAVVEELIAGGRRD